MFHHENIPWREFIEKVKSKYQNKIDFFCTDPPFGVLAEDRDFTFSEMDMQDVSGAIFHFLRPTGTFFIFCSQQQIPDWTKALLSKNLKLITHSFVITLDPSGY